MGVIKNNVSRKTLENICKIRKLIAASGNKASRGVINLLYKQFFEGKVFKSISNGVTNRWSNGRANILKVSSRSLQRNVWERQYIEKDSSGWRGKRSKNNFTNMT